MIHEDLLLSRIDILENKLLCYQKNITNEKLQDEVVKLQDDKSSYQVIQSKRKITNNKTTDQTNFFEIHTYAK